MKSGIKIILTNKKEYFKKEVHFFVNVMVALDSLEDNFVLMTQTSKVPNVKFLIK